MSFPALFESGILISISRIFRHLAILSFPALFYTFGDFDFPALFSVILEEKKIGKFTKKNLPTITISYIFCALNINELPEVSTDFH